MYLLPRIILPAILSYSASLGSAYLTIGVLCGCSGLYACALKGYILFSPLFFSVFYLPLFPLFPALIFELLPPCHLCLYFCFLSLASSPRSSFFRIISKLISNEFLMTPLHPDRNKIRSRRWPGSHVLKSLISGRLCWRCGGWVWGWVGQSSTARGGGKGIAPALSS